MTAIKSERGMIETPQERKRDEVANSSSSSQRRAAPQQQPRVMSFFEALFGGGRAQAQARPVPPRRVTR
jgi:hypothetical protein